MYTKILILIGLPLMIFAAEWQSLNGPPAGRADDMSIGWDPLHGYYVIYAADQTHKLYKSTNEGEYWDSLPPEGHPNPYIINPTCVITNPDNAQVVYMGRNYSTPVYKSTNGGVDWEPKSAGITNENPRCFAMHPNSSSILYLGCKTDACAAFRTTNGGTQWYQKDMVASQDDPTVNELAINPGSPSDPDDHVLVAATDDGIYYTSNGGGNWSLKLDKSDMVSVSYANQSIVYAGRNASDEGLFKSTDGGSTWDTNPIESFSYVRAVAAVSPNEVYIAANTSSDGRGIYRTTNGGSNWSYYGRGDSLFCNDSIIEI